MTAQHLELLVEEPSTEAFLRLPSDRTFEVHAFQGKQDLLGKLESRLRAYARWLPREWRVVVVVDRDDDDCEVLKARLESTAAAAKLRTRSKAGAQPWQLVNRIAVEELEAWYFGDWPAVLGAYPRVSPAIPDQRPFRDPDAVSGGTWEAFERVLQRHGYVKTGLRKVEAARAIGAHVDPGRSRSVSFTRFHEAIADALAE